MRVTSRIPFGDRRTGESKLRKKYFFAFEGKRTEGIYFTGLLRKYQRLSNNPILFEVIMFARAKVHDGESHPQKIFSLLSKCLQSNTIGDSECTYRDLLEGYLSYTQMELSRGYLKAKVFRAGQKILSSRHLKEDDLIDQDSAKFVLEELEDFCEEHLTIKGGIENVRAVFIEIQRDDLVFDKVIDDVCLIVDRDKGSFFESQYDAVYAGCIQAGYRLFVTNPCFEFFLLLHKTDCKEYSQQELLDNEKEQKKTFVERKLKGYVPDYKKEKYSFESFEKEVETALNNAKNYACDLGDLKSLPGSNLPELIEELLQRMSAPC
ncbi:MAG TPA: hypothetical protein DCG34_04885 [Clostridiales bacterium]|nr:hypothetical protein [Clostridiales bacterium]